MRRKCSDSGCVNCAPHPPRTLKDVSRDYDRLYALGEKLFARVKPCQIKIRDITYHKWDFERNKSTPITVKKTLTCVADLPPVRNARPSGEVCCHSCASLGPNGCTVKALSCKLYSCGVISYGANGRTYLAKRLETLRMIASARGIALVIRMDKPGEMILAEKLLSGKGVSWEDHNFPWRRP